MHEEGIQEIPDVSSVFWNIICRWSKIHCFTNAQGLKQKCTRLHKKKQGVYSTGRPQDSFSLWLHESVYCSFGILSLLKCLFLETFPNLESQCVRIWTRS
jgi:hypothetical protein